MARYHIETKEWVDDQGNPVPTEPAWDLWVPEDDDEG